MSYVSNFAVHNMSSRTFDLDELRAIGLGLNFIPTPKPSTLPEISNAFMKYCRRLRLFAQFGNEEYERVRCKLPNPDFLPDCDNQAVENYLNLTWRDIADKFKGTQRRRFNVPQDLRSAINRISADSSIIINSTDKNLGPAIADVSHYLADAHRQLATNAYYEVPSNLAIELQFEVSSLLSQAVKKATIPNSAKNFIMNIVPLSESKFPELYGIWKVHKPTPVLRLICPHVSFVTKGASIFVDDQVRPLLAKVSWILPDSNSLIKSLEHEHFDPDVLLCTFDVEALYPSIPLDLGIRLFQDFLNEHNSGEARLNTFIVRLLRYVLYYNIFKFHDKFYHQKSGTAMGVTLAVVFANVFMYMLSRQLVSEFLANGTIKLYRRYIDDIFTIFKSKPDYLLFLKKFNQLHDNITLTSTCSTSSIDYLDLTIFKGPRFNHSKRLDTKTYQKPVNAYLYLPAHSGHSLSQKTAFIKGELLRYVRTCSSFIDFSNVKNLFFHRLIGRGYSAELCASISATVNYEDRPLFLNGKQSRDKSTSRPLVLSLVNTPTIDDLKIGNSLHKHADLLYNNGLDISITIARMSPPSLRSTLVRRPRKRANG